MARPSQAKPTVYSEKMITTLSLYLAITITTLIISLKKKTKEV